VGVPGTPEGEACPLCGAPLDPEQEWCLRCGAAARTRLAASSNWKAPIIALAVVAILSVGVLAAALVKLGGGFSSTTNVTRTVAGGPASVTSPGTAAQTPTAPGAATPGASTPGAVGPVALAPVTMPASSGVTLNGTINPQGVPTGYRFLYRTTASHTWSASGPGTLGASNIAGAVSARIAPLAPGTTYRYKLTASKAGRIVSSREATFTTLPAPTSPRG
jgi:hypothetical protein